MQGRDPESGIGGARRIITYAYATIYICIYKLHNVCSVTTIVIHFIYIMRLLIINYIILLLSSV